MWDDMDPDYSSEAERRAKQGSAFSLFTIIFCVLFMMYMLARIAPYIWRQIIG